MMQSLWRRYTLCPEKLFHELFSFPSWIPPLVLHLSSPSLLSSLISLPPSLLPSFLSSRFTLLSSSPVRSHNALRSLVGSWTKAVSKMSSQGRCERTYFHWSIFPRSVSCYYNNSSDKHAPSSLCRGFATAPALSHRAALKLAWSELAPNWLAMELS